MLNIYILTLFPEFFQSPFSVSIIKRACDKGLVKIELIDIRNFSHDKHRKVDDYPYGGGCGMVMKPEPIFEAIDYVDEKINTKNRQIILLSPQGKIFNQSLAQDLSKEENLVFICGHYEGIDERVKTIVTDEISIGDFILTGGEVPALAIVDAVIRLVPGVLGSSESPQDESFCNGLLEYPQYTRPQIYRNLKVPDVLLSGNHKEIEIYRHKEALKRTREKRPDLFKKLELKNEDKRLLD